MYYFIGIIAILCLATVLFYSAYSSSKKQNLELSERNQLHKEKIQEEKQRLVSTLENQYGKRGDYMDGIRFHMWVFPESKNVIIFNTDIEDRKVLPFQKILSCDVEVERIKTGEKYTPARSVTTYTTKTNGKSMLGRAIVGAVALGPAGAIIGGATAKKETTGETIVIPEEHIITYETKIHVYIKYLNNGIEDTIVYMPYKVEFAEQAKKIIESVIETR